MLAERFVRIRPVSADQADADRAPVVVDDMRADIGLGATLLFVRKAAVRSTSFDRQLWTEAG